MSPTIIDRYQQQQIELGDCGPTRNPGDAGVRGLLIQAAIPLPAPGGCAEAGGEDFRIIDAAHLHELLRAEIASRGLSAEGATLRCVCVGGGVVEVYAINLTGCSWWSKTVLASVTR